MSWPRLFPLIVSSFTLAATARALDICLPTANEALLRSGGDADYFQPTVEGTVESGMFGCVRSNGRRFHEGIDIKCLQRNRRGEPTDPVHAVADGEVAFINTKRGLSNYGRYVVIQHNWDNVSVCTLYAHLSEPASGLGGDQRVKKSQIIGTQGHFASPREGSSRARAQLQIEITFLLNPNYH